LFPWALALLAPALQGILVARCLMDLLAAAPTPTQIAAVTIPIAAHLVTPAILAPANARKVAEPQLLLISTLSHYLMSSPLSRWAPALLAPALLEIPVAKCLMDLMAAAPTPTQIAALITRTVAPAATLATSELDNVQRGHSKAIY